MNNLKWCNIYIFEVSDIGNFNAIYNSKIKNILNTYSNSEQIFKTINGKPFFNANSNIFFSKSKRLPYFTIAIGNFEMGIDMELLENQKHLLQSKTKNDLLDNINTISEWSLKEAVVKSYGGVLQDVFDLIKKDSNIFEINNNKIISNIIYTNNTYIIALAYEHNIKNFEIKIENCII
jgi:phosphopantetheinyl transferase